jgi:hypothetical protein
MMEVKIYVEGNNDLVFFGTYLQEVFGFVADDNPMDRIHKFTKESTIVELIKLDGYTTLNIPDIQEDIQYALEDGIKVLVIIDADTSTNDGGFEVRKTQVEAIQASVPFEYFLVPNGELDGDLETVLQNILLDEYQAALKCFIAQNQCLEEVNKHIKGVKFKLASEKGVLDSFLSRLKNKGDDKFKDPTIWNLNHPYLEPLKTFLETHLH